MSFAAKDLELFRQPQAVSLAPVTTGPPERPDVLAVSAGNGAEAIAQRIRALAMQDGNSIAAVGINNDGLAPRPIAVRLLDGTLLTLEFSERFVMRGDNPRDRLDDYAVLQCRYRRNLRGVPVLETYNRAGYGGHGHPVISALDIDLHVHRIIPFLRQHVRRVRRGGGSTPSGSDMQRLLDERRHQAALRDQPLRIAVIGGGSGSMGNAGHQLLPYLLRHVLREMGIADYELWGFILGPQAFSGLTPYVNHNYRALLEAMQFLAQHGHHRDYIDGLRLSIAAPPYDRLFLFDDPGLPGVAQQVSEAELEAFLNRTALAIYLLLGRGTIWSTIASHAANPRELHTDGRLRFLASARVALADVDRVRVRGLLQARLAADLLDRVAATVTV